MKLAMTVSALGSRSRSSPPSSSATGVVAARMADAATPRVPLTTMFQAAQTPPTASDTPRTSTRGPWPTTGRNTANSRNGSSMTRRLASRPGGTRPVLARPARARTYSPKAQNASRGVATTARTNSRVAAILHWGRARSGGSGRLRPVAVGAQGADHGEQGQPDAEGDQHADQPGDAGAEPVVADALDGVAGQGPVLEQVLPGVGGDAVVLGDLVEPIRGAGGEPADQHGQADGGQQAAEQEDAEVGAHRQRTSPAVSAGLAPRTSGVWRP